MAELHKLIDSDFTQPLDIPYDRKVSGLEEDVDFLQGSHVRIWYNTDIVSYDMHYHNALEIIYMYESDTLIKLTDKDILLQTGDLIFIPPYVTHQTRCLHPNKQFVIMLDVSTLSDFNLESITKLPTNSALLINKDNKIYESVCNQIIDMINEYFSYNPYWELSVFSSFLSIAANISKAHLIANTAEDKNQPSIPAPSNNKEHYDKFTELMQYIDENFSEPLSLDYISSHVGFSKYHFIRLFKEYTGSTFYDYLTNKRIQYAKELLSSNMGITDIAFSCGFNNQTSFCRSFKNIVGCPPTEYRSKLRHE